MNVRRLVTLSFVVFGLQACNHLYYYPDKQIHRSPETYTFPVTELSIPRENQGPIHAWLMNDTESSKGLVLHFHGNAQNLTAHAGFSDWLAAEGYTVLIFDYSGYGRTEGQPSQEVLIDDSLAVAHYLDENDKWKKRGLPFIVFGQSLGGAVAVTSLAENADFAERVDLLLVESSFDSYRELARAKLKSQTLTWLFNPIAYFLVSDYREPAEAIKTLKMPKIIVHGTADEVVYFANGKALFDAASAPKEFWEIPTGQHTEAFLSGSAYRSELLEKLQALPFHSEGRSAPGVQRGSL